MSLGIITNSGRILMARLLLGAPLDGITHCAIGDGDETFVDPLIPPTPMADQVGLKHERARKRFYKRSFLKENPAGPVVVNDIHYAETTEETNIVGLFFRFDEGEANNMTVKEYGFFGGTVAYCEGVAGDYAVGGVYNAETNPDGQVLDPGYLYEVRNIPDVQNLPDTRMEFVGVIKV